jgi:hypothetical protein
MTAEGLRTCHLRHGRQPLTRGQKYNMYLSQHHYRSNGSVQAIQCDDIELRKQTAFHARESLREQLNL